MMTFAEGPFGAYHGKSDNIFYFELSGGTLMNSGTPIFDRTNFAHNESLALRYQFSNNYSFASQLSYSSHGVQFGQNNDYLYRSNYLTLFTPAEIELKLSKSKVKISSMMLVFGGPYITNNVGGNINDNNEVQPLSNDELFSWDYGFETGLGFRIPVFSTNTRSNITFKASYYQGMADIAPLAYTNFNSNLKSAMINEEVSINNRGFKISVCIEFSLKKLKTTTYTAGGNGKSTYERLVLIGK